MSESTSSSLQGRSEQEYLVGIERQYYGDRLVYPVPRKPRIGQRTLAIENGRRWRLYMSTSGGRSGGPPNPSWASQPPFGHVPTRAGTAHHTAACPPHLRHQRRPAESSGSRTPVSNLAIIDPNENARIIATRWGGPT